MRKRLRGTLSTGFALVVVLLAPPAVQTQVAITPAPVQPGLPATGTGGGGATSAAALAAAGAALGAPWANGRRGRR